jgi:hypothetical protein
VDTVRAAEEEWQEPGKLGYILKVAEMMKADKHCEIWTQNSGGRGW